MPLVAYPNTSYGSPLMSVQYTSFALLTLTLTGIIAFMTYRTAQLLSHWQPDRNLLLLPAENLVRAGMIAVCIGLGVMSGVPLVQLGWTLQDWLRACAWGLIWGAALALVFYLSTKWVARRTDRRFYSPAVIEAILPRHAAEYWPVMLAMIPVVILEELLFRSLLIGGLGFVIPTPLLLASTAILFGLMHAPQGAWGVTGACIAGLVLGSLFLAFGSIIAPIVAHYVANVVQINQATRVQSHTQVSDRP
jgi:membrane protease YdiL (CAAX protease family)